ncbi:MAG: FG-GAP-like repeat-containing protein [Bacteroidota bacterium]|jgi:hypothetical protein
MKTFIRAAMCGVLFLVGIGTLMAQEVTFQPGPLITPATGAGNGGFAWGDVNGDGLLDVYIPANNILLNNTTAFTQSVPAMATVPNNANAIGVVLADFNGDGVVDALNNGGGAHPVLFINNAGVFSAATAVGDLASAGGEYSNFGGVAAGAIDHSGYLSLAWGGADHGSQTGGSGVQPNAGIWLLKGGPTGFTNVGKNVSSIVPANLTQDFENRNVGDTITSIGWPGGILSTVATDPLGGTNKVLKNAINNYNSAPVLMFVIPAGKTLANYTTFTFKGYFAQGDVGYKDIIVEAYKTMPTGQFNSNTSVKIGTWNRAQGASTAWENITVNIAGSASITDTCYICFGIHAAGTGGGSATIWYADNVTLVSTASASNLAIDTTLSYEAWNVSFLDANNDGYQDLLMPSFRNSFNQVDAGTSGYRKGCVLWMNDQTGKFIIPTAATLGRPIYALDSITVAGIPYATAKGDTGIIVDDTVRHFAAIEHTWGDFNNDGNMDLMINSNALDNRDGFEVARNLVILYGKGDGTFTYKWNGTNIVANNGLPQVAGIRSIDEGDYNNDGNLDIAAGAYGGGTFANYLYKNNGDGTFTNVTTTDNVFSGGNRSIGFVDYNNDGFLDIFTYTGGTALLQKNMVNTNKWIGFKPVGKGNNTSAIGAVFTVYAGGKKQTRAIKAEAGSQGGQTLWANFGLGTTTAVDSVSVMWPDGVKQTWAGSAFTVNSYKTLYEGSVVTAAPVISRPSWTAGDTTLTSNNTLKWSKVTGGTLPIQYQVQIGSNKAMSTLLYTYPLPNSSLTDTFKVAKLPLAVKYYWRVAAISGSFQGAYSAIDSFRTNMTPATTVPTKLSPTTNQLRLPNMPTLVCSSTPEAYIYHFQLDTLNRFAVRDTTPQGAAKYAGLLFNDSTTVTDTTKKMSALTPGRKYFWRVRGWNAAGASAWAPVDSFTIMYLPATPVLAYPGHNAANVPATNLKLKWYRVDGDSNYVISSWTYSVSGLLSRIDTTKRDSSLVIASLLNRSKYYWQVRAYNQAGQSAFTAIDSFTTAIEAPGQPTAISPRNTTTEQRKTVFTWSSVLNATSYHLQVADNLSFAPIKEDMVVSDTTVGIKDTLAGAQLYFWRVSGINLGGEGVFSATAHFTTDAIKVGVDAQSAGIPTVFALLQNYPNPFNPTTTIGYELPKMSYVKLYIYDVLGRVVTTLVDGMQSANRYRVEWNPSRLSSGVYFCRIQARSQDGSVDFTSVKKLLYMK